MRDTALPPALLDGLERWVPNLRVDRVEDATHWIVHEQPKRVAGLLEDFISNS
jgi:pimeloyl-ACP methyl ester carboxylesterase